MKNNVILLVIAILATGYLWLVHQRDTGGIEAEQKAAISWLKSLDGDTTQSSGTETLR